ncbi:crosslink repair DNA glycosylase YcaQ family protein [Streptomyces sp. M10(2022)]
MVGGTPQLEYGAVHGPRCERGDREGDYVRGRRGRLGGGGRYLFPRRAGARVRLLPYFDAFTIASQPRERLFPGAAFERALAGGQAGNFPVLLVDGVVAGSGTSAARAAGSR